MRIVNLANLEQFAAVNLSADQGAIGGPVVVPSCAQIVLGWSLEDGKTGHNVLYGRYSGAFAGTVAQANAILTALTTGAAWTGLAAFMATSTILRAVTIRDVNTANQAIISSTGTGAPGTSASPALPNETSLAITLPTAFTGPGNRGRMFVPGYATNALGAGNIAAAGAVTATQTWFNGIATALAAQGYTFVLGQKARKAYIGSTGTSHPARSATSTPIVGGGVRDNHWDSQRRRGLK